MAVSVSGQSECADKQRISRPFEIAAQRDRARDNSQYVQLEKHHVALAFDLGPLPAGGECPSALADLTSILHP